jgi:hypothetical protein
MGQLKAESAVFLSAGVPDPAAPHFLGEGDSVAISAAVAALLEVTLGRRKLVWGGHPAITPMVWAFAESMGVDYSEWVLLYQSLRFEDEFPEETALFHNVVFTERIGDDISENLALMRSRMIEENQFDAAVFIGGMQGVLDEYRLFLELAPNAGIIPVASTGGAARVLNEMLGDDPLLAANLNYVQLLYERLGIDPNERRYPTPASQPTDLADRIEIPGHSRS